MKPMNMSQLITSITPADEIAMELARRHWDGIAKPLGGLGRLEELLVTVAGAQGTPMVRLERKAVAVFCADNGVVAEGVTQPGQEVTLAVARAMGAGESSVCQMAKVAGATVTPIDVGMAVHPPVPGLLERSVCPGGTANIARGPAMTREQCFQALFTGVRVAEELIVKGAQLLAAGEMGIGNTTTAAAVSCVLLNRAPEELVGRGAGLSNEGLKRKRETVARALAVNQPDAADPIDVLCKVGGFDIAAMTGFYMGAARNNVPVILDGAISCAAALLAVGLAPNAKKAMLPSHLPSEPCGPLLLEALGLVPVLHGQFHLGEGTGAVALMPLLDMASAIYHSMTSFDGLGIEAYRPDGSPVGGVNH